MSEERRVIFRIDADTSMLDNKAASSTNKMRDAELAFYRITILVERLNRVAKQFFGVELPKGTMEAINEIQTVMIALRSMQMLAKSAWLSVLGPVAAIPIVTEYFAEHPPAGGYHPYQYGGAELEKLRKQAKGEIG